MQQYVHIAGMLQCMFKIQQRSKKNIDLRHDGGIPSPGADINAVGIMNGQLKE